MRLWRPAYKINHLNLIWVSIYEGHSNKNRPISNYRTEMEAKDVTKEMFNGANNDSKCSLLCVKLSGLIS